MTTKMPLPRKIDMIFNDSCQLKHSVNILGNYPFKTFKMWIMKMPSIDQNYKKPMDLQSSVNDPVYQFKVRGVM